MTLLYEYARGFHHAVPSTCIHLPPPLMPADFSNSSQPCLPHTIVQETGREGDSKTPGQQQRETTTATIEIKNLAAPKPSVVTSNLELEVQYIVETFIPAIKDSIATTKARTATQAFENHTPNSLIRFLRDLIRLQDVTEIVIEELLGIIESGVATQEDLSEFVLWNAEQSNRMMHMVMIMLGENTESSAKDTIDDESENGMDEMTMECGCLLPRWAKA